MSPQRPSSAMERALVATGSVVGIDEVGRGALAGPVLVGAVLINSLAEPPEGLADSKTLSARRRAELVEPIGRWARDVAIGAASADEIDAWGLRLALAVAADRALRALAVAPTHALVDGNLNLLCPPETLALGRARPALAFATLPVTTVVKGDLTCSVIAAASIIAKVARDALMRESARAHPVYGWERNVGYGTTEHLDALRRHGPCALHRRSWSLPPVDGSEV